jgi:tRNA pseudouridine55 synthase
VPRQPEVVGLDGVLVVAKPAGPTSHDVVALVRRLSGTRRIGHGGTLDPFASGVLPLFLGHAVRLAEYHLGSDKAYRATVCFGATSTTDDLDGELSPVDGPGPSLDRVVAALPAFTGPILQRPPDYSAIQVQGRRAYQLARTGEPVELEPRAVTIRELTLRTWDDRDPDRPVAVLDIRCSAGTYVRALARDLGAAVGSGAYLGALARVRSGAFEVAEARSLEEIRAAAAAGAEAFRALLLPADAGLDALPSVTLDAREVDDAIKGRYIRPTSGTGALPEGVTLRLLGPDGRIVGIGRRSGARIAPEKILVWIGPRAGHA